MSIATYRGIEYDTQTPKAEYQQWYLQTHCDASKTLTYRGKDYRPSKTNDNWREICKF